MTRPGNGCSTPPARATWPPTPSWPRLGSLHGLRVALLENTKPNGAVLLQHVGRELQEKLRRPRGPDVPQGLLRHAGGGERRPADPAQFRLRRRRDRRLRLVQRGQFGRWDRAGAGWHPRRQHLHGRLPGVRRGDGESHGLPGIRVRGGAAPGRQPDREGDRRHGPRAMPEIVRILGARMTIRRSRTRGRGARRDMSRRTSATPRSPIRPRSGGPWSTTRRRAGPTGCPSCR